MQTQTHTLAPAAFRRLLWAIIAAISVVGLSLGLTVPLVSLNLEHRGADSTLIGMMAAAPALGLLLFSAFIPTMVARCGVRVSLYGALLMAGGTVFLLPFFEDYRIWLLLRFFMGIGDGILFTLSETWINQIAVERNRGRLIALYSTALSLCMACGPLLIGLTGTTGLLPFMVAAGIVFTAALPFALTGKHAPQLAESSEFNVFGFVRLAPGLCAAVMLFALLDACGLSLLPLFGLRHGYDETSAAAMVTALIAGNIALQLPLGWLADHMDRQRLQWLCAAMMLVCSLLLPLVATTAELLWPTLVLLGSAGGGVYTLAVILVGQRFQGVALVTANAAFGMLWGIGSLAGPLIAGFAMRLHDPDGMPLVLALASGLFLFFFRHRPAASDMR